MKILRLILLFMFAITAFAVAPAETLAAKPELPKTGVNLARADGGWLNVLVEDHRFVVNFFDADKKPIPPDAGGGLARFIYVAKATNRRRVPLAPGDGNLRLVSPIKVLPPHVFRVFLTLYHESTEESYAFQYP